MAGKTVENVARLEIADAPEVHGNCHRKFSCRAQGRRIAGREAIHLAQWVERQLDSDSARR